MCPPQHPRHLQQFGRLGHQRLLHNQTQVMLSWRGMFLVDLCQNQNPLDVLEDILSEAKQKAGAANSKQKKQSDEELEKEKRLAELEKQAQERKQQEAILLQQKVAELQQVKHSPQYQARTNQEQQKQEQKQKQAEELEGHEIIQLKHSKI